MIVTHHPFVKAVASALRRRCGVPAGSRVLVATSGGADSVALLRALAAIAPRRRWKLLLAVGHVQHHLRDSARDCSAAAADIPAGEEGPVSDGAAEADARFTRELAEKLEIPFLRRDLDLSMSDRKPRNLEAEARRHRYGALEVMAQDFGADFLATAHHGDDQLETILMRLLRGTSVRGLRGIAWRRRLAPDSDVQLVRPMLGVDRAAVGNILADLDQPWCEDHTNTDTTRLRARLRHDVLPVLRAVRPDAARKAVALTGHMRQFSRLLDETARSVGAQIIQENGGEHSIIDRAAARRLLEPVLYEVVRNALAEAGSHTDSLTHRALGPIVKAIRDRKGGERRFELNAGVTLTITRGQVQIDKTRLSSKSEPNWGQPGAD